MLNANGGAGGDAQGDTLERSKTSPAPVTPTTCGRRGVNVLKGLDGNDKLKGFGGADRLYGGDGADISSGWTGTTCSTAGRVPIRCRRGR